MRTREKGGSWFGAVHAAVHRLVERHERDEFTRAELLREEGQRICEDTGTEGRTPEQTLSYYLQKLRDAGIIAFVDNHGTYRVLKHRCDLARRVAA